jgi:L-ascorbate metabolism protein UlaG (beta-lactamase superfamily)
VGSIPFVPPLDDVRYGTCQQLSPLVQRVIANNPSKFTYRGTGTYIIGRNDVAVIDPGPDNADHKRALEEALKGRRVVGIVVTHCHADHVPLAGWLRDVTGAPTFAIGSHPRPIEQEVEDEAEDENSSTTVTMQALATTCANTSTTNLLPRIRCATAMCFLPPRSGISSQYTRRATHRTICV